MKEFDIHKYDKELSKWYEIVDKYKKIRKERMYTKEEEIEILKYWGKTFSIPSDDELEQFKKIINQNLTEELGFVLI